MKTKAEIEKEIQRLEAKARAALTDRSASSFRSMIDALKWVLGEGLFR